MKQRILSLTLLVAGAYSLGYANGYAKAVVEEIKRKGK